jgi:S1-C subfamily serine protease
MEDTTRHADHEPADPVGGYDGADPATGSSGEGDGLDATPEPAASGEPTLHPGAGLPLTPPAGTTVSRFRNPVPDETPAVVPLDPEGPPALERPADAARRGPSAAADPAPARRSTQRGPAALVGIVSGVLGAALTLGVLAALGTFDRPETIVQAPAPPGTSPPIVIEDGDPGRAAVVARKVVPSIVAIEVAADNGDDTFSAFASGSGVVLSRDGLIVTNQHVIEGADLAQVVLQNGVVYQATVIGGDRVTDLAVLRIDAPGLIPIELGSTETLSIGDMAVAVGNPLGLPGGASVTVGVVSAFDREVTVGAGTNDRLFGMLQTDAPITRGSSGGALVDGRGRLIGITTAIGVTDAGAEGVGFAIPVELMTRITDELIDAGSVRHTFLGVWLEDFFTSRDGAQIPNGAVVRSVIEPSGAFDAGLREGDRLVAIDGRPIITKEDIINTLRELRVGDTISLEIVRDGSPSRVDVTLGERPEDPGEEP